MRKHLLSLGLVAVSAGVASNANAAAAAAVDVADVVTGIGNQLTSIASIGTAILGLVVAIAAYRWVRRVIK